MNVVKRYFAYLRQAAHDLGWICWRELRQTVRDQGVLIFFLVVPLAYPLVYAFIYTNEVVRDVPVAVVDDSRTSRSRLYVRHLDASPDVRVVSFCADMDEARRMLRRREAYGIVYLPANFNDELVRGRQTCVKVFCDMSGLLYYKALLSANTYVSLDMNADIKMLYQPGLTKEQEKILTQPIAYEEVSLYNPQNGFAAFLIPAVLVLVIHQTLLLGIGLSAGTARERNSYAELVPVNRHFNGLLRIVLGKGLAYLLVYVPVAVYVLGVVPRLFRLNHLGAPPRWAPSPSPSCWPPSFRHDGLCGHAPARDVHPAHCLHLGAAALHLRRLVAAFGRAHVLAGRFLLLPLDVRHQRLHPHQQHGGHPAAGQLRVVRPVGTGRVLLPDHMRFLPRPDHRLAAPPHCAIQGLESHGHAFRQSLTPDGGRGTFRREAGRQKNPDATPRGMPEFVP